MKVQKRSVLLLWILMMLIFIATEARWQTSLGKIGSSLKANQQLAKEQLGKIEKYLKDDDGLNGIASTIDAVGSAAPSLTSGDVAEIVSGTLDILSSITELIPKVGPIISSIFTVISGLVSSIGGGDTDIGSVVRKAIDEALRKFDDSNLRAEAYGTEKVFGDSLAYLDGITDLQEHELSALSAHIPIYSGVKFLGIIQSKIRDSSKSQDEQQVKRAIEYTRLFVKLTVLRSAVLWKMYITVKQAGHSVSTANSIQNVIQNMKSNDKEFLKFLTNPTYQQAIFFVHLKPSELPEVSKYLGKCELAFQNLAFLGERSRKFRTQKWPTWYAFMRNDKYGSITGTTNLNNQGYFLFDTISSVDNTFYLRSVKWPEWYVYMRSGAAGRLNGWKGNPGSSGQWKVIRFSDGYYMLSPEKWLDWFVYMKNDPSGTVRGWKGDPGEQGHWMII
ncbi:toxin CfTX-A-like isoform X1 [Mytilus californianus]|uniref:toxin CfTX-A-like isoform X1 n=1 Tax=Mytilus californianus TaxID=6549 RepID=UPI002246AFC2|nr:toxin CfTX-A-like isoform X1 [Mytilus californianus]XP_052099329.1 toxin CfTX-A-like isoform X1 [Mytilus californianus]XP_052099332.1 toxin CfTX-A-like isoform X1 [Mytilus californianus]XP_052099339.1 toxin CfTX-A-like isoform X1 [Mytilus californianus]XP_052099340.1 toxin CfTX-A-like isoform X1 [Mytilus californianus]XP_052099346.1 toxin CfTX-A-like isoform X1 [Mytilus californianus]XP_052099347.1 toxin CfTX-A-like isoform X1 [Mytilus californianus]